MIYVYDTDGAIIQCVDAPDQEASLYAVDGRSVLVSPTRLDIRCNRVEAGALVPCQPPQPPLSQQRQTAYLALWPWPQQLEAHAEAAAGRPEKLTQMLADLAAIKASLPYPEDDNGTI